MNSPLESVKGFARGQIRAAAIDAHPFPHVCVPNLFPDEYYEELLAKWPVLDSFGDVGAHSWVIYFRPYFQSMIERMERNGSGLMRPEYVEHYSFWTGFRSVVETAIVPALVEKFSDHARDLMRDRPFRRKPTLRPDDVEIIVDQLVIRRPGSSLEPHVDDLRSLIQVLLYLPSDDDHPELGTWLYEQTSPGRPLPPSRIAQSPRQAQNPRDGMAVKEAKRIPYRRNTLLANLNHPEAWHAQYINENYDRRSYLAFVGVRAKLLPWFFQRADVKAFETAPPPADPLTHR